MRTLRLTEADLKAISQRLGARTVNGAASAKEEARGKASAPGARLNKTETRYAQDLEYRKRAGEIADWKFEAIKLRLADMTTYTPDFAVWQNDGTLDFHEVKGGFIRDDALVKLKVAAEIYKYHRFLLVQYKKDERTTKQIGGHHEPSKLLGT